jgi:hypothetical protein
MPSRGAMKTSPANMGNAAADIGNSAAKMRSATNRAVANARKSVRCDPGDWRCSKATRDGWRTKVRRTKVTGEMRSSCARAELGLARLHMTNDGRVKSAPNAHRPCTEYPAVSLIPADARIDIHGCLRDGAWWPLRGLFFN